MWSFMQNYLATLFFKVTQYGYKTFQNNKLALPNHIMNKAPNLHSVINSEMNAASITNKRLYTAKREG